MSGDGARGLACCRIENRVVERCEGGEDGKYSSRA